MPVAWGYCAPIFRSRLRHASDSQCGTETTRTSKMSWPLLFLSVLISIIQYFLPNSCWQCFTHEFRKCWISLSFFKILWSLCAQILEISMVVSLLGLPSVVSVFENPFVVALLEISYVEIFPLMLSSGFCVCDLEIQSFLLSSRFRVCYYSGFTFSCSPPTSFTFSSKLYFFVLFSKFRYGLAGRSEQYYYCEHSI